MSTEISVATLYSHCHYARSQLTVSCLKSGGTPKDTRPLTCQFKTQQLLTTERKSPAPIIIIFSPTHMQEDKSAHSLAFIKWSLTSGLSQESNFNNL